VRAWYRRTNCPRINCAERGGTLMREKTVDAGRDR
jgi:hypothetical protein